MCLNTAMMPDNDKILRKIIALAAQNADVCILWLYGSRASGTASASSDFDLAVAFNTFPNDSFVVATRPELLAMEWRSALGLPEDKLSVVDINHCPMPLALNIIEADRPLLVKDDLRLAREQTRVWGLWSDLQLYNRGQSEWSITR